MKYDAVVLLGSGFKGIESDEIDEWGVRRFGRAVDLMHSSKTANLLITGQTRHKVFGITFAEKVFSAAVILLSRDRCLRPSEAILRDQKSYPPTTRGDVGFALSVALMKKWKGLLFVTEYPHWLFRVRPMARRLAKEAGLRIEIGGSCLSAPLWYWIKEFVYWFALLIDRGNEFGRASRFARKLWKNKLAERVGLYVTNKV